MIEVENKLKDIKAPNTHTVEEIVDQVNKTGGIVSIRVILELLSIIEYLVDRIVFTDSERFNH